MYEVQGKNNSLADKLMKAQTTPEYINSIKSSTHKLITSSTLHLLNPSPHKLITS